MQAYITVAAAFEVYRAACGVSVSGARRLREPGVRRVVVGSATEQTAQLFAHLSCPSTCTDAADAAPVVNAAIMPHASSYAGPIITIHLL